MAAECAIFGLPLLSSTLIGFFIRHRWKSSNQYPKFFQLGDGRLNVVPVSLSLMVSFVSGYSLLGIPAEVYQRGLLMWIRTLMSVAALITFGLLFLPKIMKSREISISIYRFLEDRFHSPNLRQLSAFLFILNTLFYIAMVMYLPALGISGVYGIPFWPFIISVGAICTLYTFLGGLTAVVWADAFDAGFMYLGMLILIIKGTIDVGGVEQVWSVAVNTSRVAPLGFLDPSPFQYFSLWIAIFGGTTRCLSLFGLNQTAVQRFYSVESLAKAYVVIGLTAICLAILLTFCSYLGLLMVTFFQSQDPLSAGQVSNTNELVIYFATRTLGRIPGLSGLFLAGLCSGTISTVSSGIHAMATVTWEDFLKDLHITRSIRNNSSIATLVNQLLVVMYGIFVIALAFAAGPTAPHGGILKATLSRTSALAGPVVGLFFLAVLCKFATKFAAFVGLVVAFILNTCISLGSSFYKPYKNYVLPLNSSYWSEDDWAESISDMHFGNKDVFFLFRISGFFYTATGTLFVVLIGVIVSLIEKLWKRNEADQNGVELQAQ